MTKTNRAIAIIILMLVLGCTLFGCAQNADYRTPAYFAGKYSNEHSTFYLTVTQDGETLIDDTILYFADGGYYTYKYYPTEAPTFVNKSLNSEVIEFVEKISEGMGDKVTIKRNSVKFSGSKNRVKITKSVFLKTDTYPGLFMYLNVEEDCVDKYMIVGSYYSEESGYSDPQKLLVAYIDGYVTGTIECSDGSQYEYVFTRSFDRA